MKVYDPTSIDVVFAGVRVQGYADGEFVKIEAESDDFADVVGTDGEVSRSKTSDRRATITFSLMQTSSSNALLSAISNADRDTAGGAGVGSLFIRDNNGVTLYRADKCWISKAPDVSFDREPTSRDWTLRCEKLIRLDGGN